MKLINKTKHVTYAFVSLFFISLLFHSLGCKKLVEVDAPYTSVTSDNVYSTDATAIAVITGLYANMSGGSFATGTGSLSVLSGLSADEYILLNTEAQKGRFYTNKLSANTDQLLWQEFYKYLITINTAIEKLSVSNTLTPSVKQQLTGETKFLRAFYYFYLVNLYGDVPLVLTSNYQVTSTEPRTSKAYIYRQIIVDLKDAQNLLSESFLDATLLASSSERIRPTKWAATAFLSRAYLYAGEGANAEIEASKIIDNNSAFSLSALNNSFLKASLGNKEAIWQLQPVNGDWNTEDARAFVINVEPGGFTGKDVSLDTLLIKSFEAGDERRTNWTGDTVFNGIKYSYPFKYKVATSGSSVNEYLMVLRLGEQYLIRAEVRAQQNKLSEAIADLDKIRERAGLTLIATTNPGINQTDLLDAIFHERQVELFSEWGHRWLDLKRTGKVDAVMSIAAPRKGSTWSPDWALYPIPNYDIIQNPKLIQNSGY